MTPNSSDPLADAVADAQRRYADLAAEAAYVQDLLASERKARSEEHAASQKALLEARESLQGLSQRHEAVRVDLAAVEREREREGRESSDRIALLEHRVAELEADNRQLSDALAQERRERSATETARSALLIHEEEQRSRAEADTVRAEREVAKLAARVAELEALPGTGEVEDELISLRRDFHARGVENSMLSRHVEQLNARLVTVESEAQRLRSGADSTHAAEAHAARRRIEKLEAGIGKLQGEKAELESRLTAAEEQAAASRRAMLEHAGRA